MFTSSSNRATSVRRFTAMSILLAAFILFPDTKVSADDRFSRYENYRHHPYSERNRRYSDDAFGRYKYPRGRPIPGDGLNWGNRPGDGLNYGRDRRSSDGYPDFRRYPQRRGFSDNSGPRQSERDHHDRNDADYRRDRHLSNQRGWSNRYNRGYSYGYKGYKPRRERGTRDGYSGSRYHENSPQSYRRPSSNNSYRPRINQR